MKPKIILLEDDSGLRRCITSLLKMNGYEVISASDPTLCPVYSTPAQPCPNEKACADFLLTDNRMPNMTGLEFVELQAQRGCKCGSIDKAIMSGTWNSDERARAEKLGCKMFDKPFSFEEVIAWLDEQKKTPPSLS